MVRLSALRNELKTLNWRRWILLSALLLTLLLGGYKTWRIVGLAYSLRDHIDELQAVATGSGDLRAVGVGLQGLRADLVALRGEVAVFLPMTRFLSWVPRVGGDLRAAPALIDMALSFSEAGTTAFGGLEPLVALLEDEKAGLNPLAEGLEILSSARPALDAAQAQLVEAQERRAEIDLGALSWRTARLVTQIDRYLPLIQTALEGAPVLPNLLGASDRRSYLILAQNNDELRATGGFISAVGVLTLENGEIADIDFEDSYAVDDFKHPYPDSPPPFLRYMGIDQWVFRDGNWSPDFPTSAQKAIELYRISQELNVDGVLAVDQHALQAVVAALEPLEVEGWPEPVTDENVISLVRLAWSPSEEEKATGTIGEWWRQRKRFIGDLFGAMQGKVESKAHQVNWLALARAFFQVLEERHLQIWLSDSSNSATAVLSERGWDGAIRDATSDFLMIVDTNMGFNKANAIVQESLNYRVLVFVDGTAQTTLTVRYTHQGNTKGTCDHRPRYGVDYENLINRCYWDYLRVYAPAGSHLFGATAHPVAADLMVTQQRQSGASEILPEERGKAVFGSFFVLPRGQEIEKRFVYQLPPTTLERTEQGWRYRLLVQKQAGTDAIPLRVTTVLPPGATASFIDPSGEARKPESNVVVFDTTLQMDRVFEVMFRFDGH